MAEVCVLNDLGKSGDLAGTHPSQLSPPGFCLLSVQDLTLDQFMASNAAEASAEAERHLAAVRRQTNEAEQAVKMMEAAIAASKAPMPALADGCLR